MGVADFNTKSNTLAADFTLCHLYAPPIDYPLNQKINGCNAMLTTAKNLHGHKHKVYCIKKKRVWQVFFENILIKL